MINRRQFLNAGIVSSAYLLANPSWASVPSLAELSLTEASRLVQRGDVSPVALTQACLNKIKKYNPSLNAFVTVTAEQALASAKQREQELAQGKNRGPLHGIPIGLKDNIDTANIRTTAASQAFAERIPTEDAEVVTRLKNAGAIILGKLNMDECAYGISTTTGIFGATQNPWRAGYSTGGSSGGPAAAVAASLCYGAIGTDTGGSIRQPAAWCGVTGLKPSFGLVSTRGVIPLSWSLDHVGPLTRNAEDAAILLQAISSEAAEKNYLSDMKMSVAKLRLGKPADGYYQQLDPEVEVAMAAALTLLDKISAGIKPMTLPPVPPLTVMFVEATAFYDEQLQASPENFSPAVRGLLTMGGKISSTVYARDLRKLSRLREDIHASFKDVDLLITPTTPNLPISIEEAGRPVRSAGPPAATRNTLPFDLYGLPTVSIPCGFSRSGLPIGLQISGRPGAEAQVLALAAAWQQHTDWHQRQPTLN